MASEFEKLSQRLADVEARLEILNLEAEYSRSWDVGDANGWASVFTKDGAFEMTPVGHQEHRVIQGAEGLANFCDEVNDYYRGLHFNTTPSLQIEGDTASAQVHFQWLGVYRVNERFTGERRSAGYYHVYYRKVDGRWLIERRVETQIWGGSNEAYNPFIADHTE